MYQLDITLSQDKGQLWILQKPAESLNRLENVDVQSSFCRRKAIER